MDDKLSARLRFPPNVGGGSRRPTLHMDLSGSLVHNNNHETYAPQDTSVFRLLWRAWQKPIGKIGTMVLFLSWLLLAMATSASVLSWIGTIGVVSGATLIGLSLFASYSRNARTDLTQTEESTYGRNSPP